MIHELKCWPEPFQAIVRGDKTFEIRKDDRPFSVGDFLHLREWSPNGEAYLGRETVRLVTYLIRGGEWDLPKGLVVMGLRRP